MVVAAANSLMVLAFDLTGSPSNLPVFSSSGANVDTKRRVCLRNNYHAWSRSMRMALMSKNKMGFINGNLPAPPVNDPDHHAWEQCDSMVLSWLLNSVSGSIAHSVMWLNSAREVWIDIQERFSHGDHFRLSDLLEEVNSVRQNDLCVTDYYTKLKIIWEELLILRPYPNCTCNPICNCGAIRAYRDYFES